MDSCKTDCGQVDLSSAERIANGGAASVFRVDGRAFKVFHNPASPNAGTYGSREACVQAVFEAEVAAWKKIQACDYLVQHTPKFHGVRVATGLDPEEFFHSCCYEMDFLEGAAEKVDGRWTEPHLAQAKSAFEAVDVAFYEDASCFDIESPSGFRLIDFADRDVMGNDDRCIRSEDVA